jgi:hypothetical protein
VTTSRICLTLLLDGLEALQSCEYRAFRAASQSNGERTDLALNGDRAVALRGESRLETAGETGTCKLGKEVAPVGGADMGWVG